MKVCTMQHRFHISEQKAWDPFHRRPESVQTLIARLTSATARVRAALREEPSHQVRGALQFLRYVYTADAIRGEGISDFDADRVEALVLAPSQSLDAPMTRAELAGYNVFHAMAFILGDITPPFTVENIRRLHAKVGCGGLIANAGEYRTRHAAPVGSSMMYRSPEAIESSLRNLVTSHADKVASDWDTDEDAIKAAAKFVADFLAIHPFRDGNGRVARLCLSWMLKRRFVVPISLACGGRMSEGIFLQCLEAAECRAGRPSQLARYVLECAADTATGVVYASDL